MTNEKFRQKLRFLFYKTLGLQNLTLKVKLDWTFFLYIFLQSRIFKLMYK